MGSNKKSYYTQRNAEMLARWEGGESLLEIMMFANLKIQRTCQILGIPSKQEYLEGGNGHKPAPKPVEPEIGPYWVTCNKQNISFLEWIKPSRCKYCQEKDLTIEKQVWTKPTREKAPC